jgi:hypothetical protein
MPIERKDNQELRETLLALFRKVYPKGNPDKQKEMCEELPLERLLHYIKMLEDSKRHQDIL